MKPREPGAFPPNAAEGSAQGSLSDGVANGFSFLEVFLGAPIATAIVDLAGRIVAVNDSFAEILGRERESLAGLPLLDLAHPEDRHWRLPKQRGEGRPRYEIERRYLHASGAILDTQECAAIVSGAAAAACVVLQLQDVTGRRSAATSLLEREARLRLLVDQIPAIVWTVDSDLRITSGLGRQLDLIGVSANDSADVSLFDYFQTADPEVIAISAHRRALAGEAVTFEMEWKGRIFRTRLEPLRTGLGGPVVGAIGVASDVTDLRRAENDLRSSEEKFRSLAETMSAAAFIFQGAQLVYANPAAQAITGFSGEELAGMSFWDVIHPVDRELVRQRGLQRQRGEAVPNRYEVRICTKSGEERWVDYTGGAILFAGQTAVLGTAFDITERKRAEAALRESEERFRAVFAKSPLGIAVIDRDERLLDANDALCRMTGFAREELEGLSVEEASHPAELALNIADLHSLFSEDIRFLQRERRLVRKNGEIGWFRLSAAAVRGESGTAGYWLTMIEDITEHRRSEDAARAHLAELSRVLRVRSLGELAAGLAHELNQPLAAVVSYAKGCVHRLRTGELAPADLVEKLDRIADEALRAGSIIRWVQRFLRKEEPRREPTDLGGLVRNIVRLVETEARRPGIEIRARIDDGIPLVPLEAVQIEQVLFNLVRNGLDALALRGGDGAVEIRARLEDEMVCVEVRDEGPGLGPGDPERIFEPFYSTKSEGMGLGLSISRSIVEAHGGSLILVESGEPGTIFRFTLPATAGGED